MGIGSIYKQLYFDSESSGSYGLYITGEGVFNAPERDAEFVTIPGRNGEFLLDHGRFENIEITYPAGCFGNTEGDFADNIAAIRAWLCSKRGYVRLEDDYNPNEYRLAVYKSGLEVSPALLRAGEFSITFECMPQRFLKSGEVAETMALAIDSISNPTEFPSRPMLEVTGYGQMTINGWPVVINSQPIGNVACMASYSETKDGVTNGVTFVLSPDYSALNTGDDVEINLGGDIQIGVFKHWTSPTVNTFTETGGLFQSPIVNVINQIDVPLKQSGSPFTFQLGTAKTATASASISADIYGVTYSFTVNINLSIDSDGVLTFTVTATTTAPSGTLKSCILTVNGITGDSTKSALGSPVYIDLDIGEAWKIEGGQKVSVNNAVSLPSELPELNPGANEIVHEYSITDLKIVPRWWTV